MDQPREFVDARPNKFFFRHIVRKIFLEDWAMKLVALLITLGLWLGVTGLSTPTTERMAGVPLNLRYSSDIEVTNSPIKEVDLILSGDKRRIAQINKNDLRVSVDISDIPPGDRVLSLEPEDIAIQLPTGIKIDQIQPNKIAVRIEAVAEKEVPVRPQTEGNLPNGYEIYAESASPPTVRVRGPASFVRSLEFVTTESIDLTGRTSDFVARQIPISVSNPQATMLETVVDVAFRIGEERVERAFSVPTADGTKRASVVLYGGRSLFEGVTGEDLAVDLVRNEAGGETPQLRLPPALDGRVEIRQLRMRP